jgi:hypothetical protein
VLLGFLGTLVLYLHDIEVLLWDAMSRDLRYYKGKFKVAILSESEGNYVVEALEGFEDETYGKVEKVKAGERRIVAPNLLFKRRGLPPIVKEHTYELKMEKKLMKLVEEEEKKEGE